MKRANQYRALWVESLIQRQPDGLLHPEPDAGEEPKKKKTGPKPRIDTDEIEACLSCPYLRCKLDDDKPCRRLHRAAQKAKEEKKNDTRGT